MVTAVPSREVYGFSGKYDGQEVQQKKCLCNTHCHTFEQLDNFQGSKSIRGALIAPPKVMGPKGCTTLLIKKRLDSWKIGSVE
jgi:hypothetical protein